jgi:hypothetical protein
MLMTPTERRLRSKLAAHKSWAHTENRSARTRAARQAFDARFERIVDPDGKLSPDERARRAQNARKEHFARMAYESARAPRGAR